MAKLILSVGFRFPGDLVEFVSLTSRRSLLDADLVIFRPSVEPFAWVDSNYQGKRSLQEASSFDLKEAAAHWRQQIQFALNTGKNIIVFLPTLQEVWVDTGQRSHTGTGRSRTTTRHVEMFDNYRMLPNFTETVIASEGTQMRLTTRGEFLKPYWDEFGESSVYKVIFSGLKVSATITAGAGGTPVAGYFTMTGAKAKVLLLPALAEFDTEPEGASFYFKHDAPEWSDEAKQFGQNLLTSLRVLDTVMHNSEGEAPPPEWAGRDEFISDSERLLNAQILTVDSVIEGQLANKAALLKNLAEKATLRRLLYAKGKALEAGILEALSILGFRAEPFRNADSEFDAVFVSTEGRFIGEAEGKDAKQINIDKLRQLEMNVQEDLARDDVDEAANGVLFGNAFRLTDPSSRSVDFFTEKCLKAAARSGTALVRTTDLFTVALLVRETSDQRYATACRRALLEQRGNIVTFPSKGD